MMSSLKLAIGLKQTKYLLFHKSRRSDDLPLRLPSLKLNENSIYRVDYQII